MTASPKITPTVTVKQHVIKQKQLRVDQKFVCKECSQVYTHRSSLLKHHLKKHGKKHIEQGMIILKIIDVKTSDISDDVIEQNYESVREYFDDESWQQVLTIG